MSKERPILFSTPMVQAILDGRKTQTRRTRGLNVINQNPNDWQFEWMGYACKLPWRFTQKSSVNKKSLKDRTFNQEAIKCPYGQAEDILWVRETWNYDPHKNVTYVYKEQGENQSEKWKSPRFMPKEACRIKLEITGIRVERLHNISEEDACEEGTQNYYGVNAPYSTCKVRFSDLWDSINEKRGYGWDINPWVWVIEFEKL